MTKVLEQFIYRFPKDNERLPGKYRELEKEGFREIKPKREHYSFVDFNTLKDCEIVVFMKMNGFNVVSKKRGKVFNPGRVFSKAVDIVLDEEYRIRDTLYGCFYDKIRRAYVRRVMKKEEVMKRLLAKRKRRDVI